MDELVELFKLRDAMFNEFGEDVVREIADKCEFPVDIVPDMLDDETTLDMFAEMVNFLVEELAEIDIDKAQTVLDSVGIPDGVVKDLLGF